VRRWATFGAGQIGARDQCVGSQRSALMKQQAAVLEVADVHRRRCRWRVRCNSTAMPSTSAKTFGERGVDMDSANADAKSLVMFTLIDEAEGGGRVVGRRLRRRCMKLINSISVVTFVGVLPPFPLDFGMN